jgi:hypothetical protein
MAWEVLRDTNKKILYDATYTKTTSTPASTPKTSSQTPHPTSAPNQTTNEQQAQAESARKRSEYLAWLRTHDMTISTASFKVNSIKSNIEALDKQDQEARAKLAQSQSWWSYFMKQNTLSDEEKLKMVNERLQRSAARTIKEERLKEAEGKLGSLKAERDRREAAENYRLGQERQRREEVERKERERMETLRKKAQEEYWRKVQEEQEASMKAEKEAMERRESERKKAAAEAKRKQREVEEKFRQRQKQEEKEAESRRYQEAFPSLQPTWAQRTAAQTPRQRPVHTRPNTTKSNRTTSKNASSSHSCLHKRFWGKELGRQECPQCEQMQYKFLLRCPDCLVEACVACMHKLRRESSSASDYSQNWSSGDYYGYGSSAFEFD